MLPYIKMDHVHVHENPKHKTVRTLESFKITKLESHHAMTVSQTQKTHESKNTNLTTSN